jgi:MFS family permease
MKNAMIDALVHLEGNPRICVYTEPLWAIPYNLYLPYASVYMLALGLRDGQIGLLVSVGLFFQIFMSLVSGPITDKLGRRLTTFIFDIISWSLPTLVWAIAQNFTWFFVAALLNSVLRVTANSWTLLMIEDAPKGKLVGIWSWCSIAGILSGFFAPLAGILVARFSLVTAVRILYANAFFFMTLKFFILFRWGTETKQGEIRMKETSGIPFHKLMGHYSGFLKKILTNPYTLHAFLIAFVIMINETVKNVFWSIMVVKELGLPESSLSFFPFIRSSAMIACYLFVTPRLNHLRFRNPLLAGFSMILVSNAVLLLSPAGSYVFVGVSTLLDAVAFSLLPPFKETLVVDAVDKHDRAGIMALFNVALLALATPFGWIAGMLSERSRFYPFMLLLVTAVAGFVLTLRITRYRSSFIE